MPTGRVRTSSWGCCASGRCTAMNWPVSCNRMRRCADLADRAERDLFPAGQAPAASIHRGACRRAAKRAGAHDLAPTDSGRAAFEQWLHTADLRPRHLRTALLARVWMALRYDPAVAVSLIEAQKRALSDWLDHAEEQPTRTKSLRSYAICARRRCGQPWTRWMNSAAWLSTAARCSFLEAHD